MSLASSSAIGATFDPTQNVCVNLMYQASMRKHIDRLHDTKPRVRSRTRSLQGTLLNSACSSPEREISHKQLKKLLLRGSLGGYQRSGSVASSKHELTRKQEVANENFSLIQRIGRVKTRENRTTFSEQAQSCRVRPTSKPFVEKAKFNIEKENLRLYL